MKDWKVKELVISDLRELAASCKGYVVMLGCGGVLNEWVNGVSQELHSAGVTTTNDPKVLWGNIYKTPTKYLRVDLVFMFKEDFKEIFDVSKLAIWRISWGGTIRLSDYLKNFKSNHENNEMAGGDLNVYVR
ncbi:hypothetical protein E3U55_09010 [Filobacillus milosensis]|uniref:Uncharacterized protein n=1 Tax=Filobacillus milosensis TaxID=94137 RepID=A0A4Y8IKC3_9BACI|nr:hypothetical protein [Filobacillus milosensis]TFB21440.1 hypothetical protein E3U55_09010 [Filobacillus milosensis]